MREWRKKQWTKHMENKIVNKYLRVCCNIQCAFTQYTAYRHAYIYRIQKQPKNRKKNGIQHPTLEAAQFVALYSYSCNRFQWNNISLHCARVSFSKSAFLKKLLQKKYDGFASFHKYNHIKLIAFLIFYYIWMKSGNTILNMKFHWISDFIVSILLSKLIKLKSRVNWIIRSVHGDLTQKRDLIGKFI